MGAFFFGKAIKNSGVKIFKKKDLLMINYRNKRYNFQLNRLHRHYWGPPARRYYKLPYYRDYII